MSLLSICQAVANEIPVAAPSTIIGNNDETAQLFLALANAAGKWLSKQPRGGWVANIREYDFTTTAAVGQLSGSVANTGPNGTAQISGLSSTAAILPLTWYAFGTFLKNNSIVATVDSSSQVTLNQPAVQAGNGQYTFGQSDYALPADFRWPVDNTMWDRSRFWSMRGPQSPQQWQLYKSSVLGNASIQRRFRFRYVSGKQVFSIDPVPTDNGSALVFEYVSSSWCISQSGTFQSVWEADTDTAILDEDLIELGLKWRVLRRLGMSYAEELDECLRETRVAMAKDGGAAILNITPQDRLALLSPWNIPETNFGNVAGS